MMQNWFTRSQYPWLHHNTEERGLGQMSLLQELHLYPIKYTSLPITYSVYLVGTDLA